MRDESIREKQRARWRRNKKAERARSKPECPPPPKEFLAKVLAERDRRSNREAVRSIWNDPKLRYWTREGRSILVNRNSGQPWIPFVADVWAARTLIEHQFGMGTATPTKIARWLTENDRLHGYASGSIRPMVYRALESLARLEGAGTSEPIWPIDCF